MNEHDPADTEPKLSPLGDGEREAISWWFRRISTTLALANAGGVVALGSLAGGSESITVAALFAYPAIALFFTGAFYAFASFGLQFVYAFLRLDAIAQVDAARIKWRKAKGLPATISLLPTLIFFAYSCLMAYTIFSSGMYFYNGAKSITATASAVACSSEGFEVLCRAPVSPLFSPPSPAAITSIKSLNAISSVDKNVGEREQKRGPEKTGSCEVKPKDQCEKGIESKSLNKGSEKLQGLGPLVVRH